MSKWVNVRCISVKEIMIEIEDSETIEDAEQIAAGEMHEYEDFKGHLIEQRVLENYKTHADKVIGI